MGTSPSTLSPSQRTSLQQNADDACHRAASLIRSSDFLVISIGDEVGCVDLSESPPQFPAPSDQFYPVEAFGSWGRCFNKSRSALPHSAYALIHKWIDRQYSSTPAALAIQDDMVLRSSQKTTAVAGWKRAAFEATGGDCKELLDIIKSHGLVEHRICSDANLQSETLDNFFTNVDTDEIDEEVLERMPIDAHSPDLPSGFHIFTSCIDGHASKIFGPHCVRECRGSVQLWQCGALEGPCRNSDVWEAPSGFTFNLQNSNDSDDEGSCDSSSSDESSSNDFFSGEESNVQSPDTPNRWIAPPGPPASRPPLHLVPMWKPQCMDGALSVAESFHKNHPRCRTCGRAFARPAVRLGGDCNWSDLTERRERYARWKRCVQKAILRSQEWQSPLRALVLEIGTSQPDVKSPSIGFSSGAVRQESESFVAAINASCGNQAATLVRISEDFPLPDRGANEGLAPDSTVPILLPLMKALLAIDRAIATQDSDSQEDPSTAPK